MARRTIYFSRTVVRNKKVIGTFIKKHIFY
ncbi:IS1 family transposase [Escherichia coli]|nr:hypothetical protein A6V17_23255 [Escherichia coli]